MFKNLKVKIACILAALGVWLFVVLQEEYNFEIDIPVKHINIKAGRMIASEIPEKVRINLRGKGNSLLSLWMFSAKNIKLELDLATINNYYEFSSDKFIEYIRIPRGFEDVSVAGVIDPDTIFVMIDIQQEKTLKISAQNILLETSDGYYQVGEFVFDPDTVVINGPRRYVKNIKELLTERKEYKSKKSDFSEELKLIIPNDELNISDINKTKASAVIQKLSEKEFTEIPVTILNKPKNSIIQITPKTIDIKVLGGKDYLSTLSKDRIFATVPYSDSWRRSSEYKIPLDIRVPPECLQYKVNLTEVIVYVR